MRCRLAAYRSLGHLFVTKRKDLRFKNGYAFAVEQPKSPAELHRGTREREDSPTARIMNPHALQKKPFQISEKNHFRSRKRIVIKVTHPDCIISFAVSRRRVHSLSQSSFSAPDHLDPLWTSTEDASFLRPNREQRSAIREMIIIPFHSCNTRRLRSLLSRQPTSEDRSDAQVC